MCTCAYCFEKFSRFGDIFCLLVKVAYKDNNLFGYNYVVFIFVIRMSPFIIVDGLFSNWMF